MGTTAKIIVVDDEKRICHNVKKILSKTNYQVTEALSAREALDMMAKDSYSLLISDIVMPETNGLELLKMVKEQWPLTKALMMTAYASPDTAVKAIRLGALDYLPKPFTPDELRTLVDKAIAGEIEELEVSPEAREMVDVIDVDIPFDVDEVEKAAGAAYARSLGPSDMPVVEIKLPENLENYCETGSMVCDIFKKLGATCKAGTKTQACPRLKKKAQESQTAKPEAVGDVKQLIGIDMPFDYAEVASVTGPEYIRHLESEGVSYVPYEELKKREAETTTAKRRTIDVDMPFDREEVAKATGETYADHLTRSDVPLVEVTADQPLEGFCETGSMVCEIFKKLGATCKAGTKTHECPQLKKKAKSSRVAETSAVGDVKTLIGVEMPFDYAEVAAAAGEEYARRVEFDEVARYSYAEIKEMVARRDASRQAQPAKTAAGKILVIDDEVAVNNNIRKILAKNGYQVDQALSRDEALDKIAGQPYALVLLDLKIPGVRGLEMLQAVRRHQPATRVIMITGYASIETAVESARMGVIDYLPKPFTPKELRRATDQALRLAA
jgi:DNA-binding response OmpR family regulator/flavodoxin